MSEHDDAEVTVRDNPEENRYEAVLEGVVAGVATYQRHDGLITFLHTEVDDAYEGHGIGGTIVRQSLDDARTQGLTVRPLCPFYRRFFDDHPEYADLRGYGMEQSGVGPEDIPDGSAAGTQHRSQGRRVVGGRAARIRQAGRRRGQAL